MSSFNGDVGVANGYLVAPNTPLSGRGWSVNLNLANRFDLSDTYYVEPLLGMTYGSYNFDNVYFNPALNSVGTSGQIGFDTINSWLGRAGANIGGTFLASDNLALAPFVHGSVWHEFVGPTGASSTVFNGGSAFGLGVTTDRVGTFGQVGVGLQFKFLSVDFLGFIRGDIRFGNNIQGQALNIGFRKQF